MKISRKWLKEFSDISVSDKEYADCMTMSGSKVETTENLSEKIKNIVVGKVLDITRHEDSDHLFICTIDAGKDAPITIVTGAQNVKKDDFVPVALHKSLLADGTKIEKGKIRGVKSEGMLCSVAELGLDLHDFPKACEDGIFILQEACEPDTKLICGGDIRPIIGYDDSIVEFEITNNRADCFCMRGLARESAATFKTDLNLPEPSVKGSSGEDISAYIEIDIESELCRRYTTRVVRNVKIEPSPAWMRQRLRALGVRPINNIVDITNYVMLEYGQPMHAFDHSFIAGGKIVVRNAEENERMFTLDGVERVLSPDMLLICDAEKPIGIAGVMGGENSEINENTRTVVFESANFDGVSVRKTALSLAMRTDSSSRFEKGLDPLNTFPAVQRACELVELLGAGEVADGIIDVVGLLEEPYTMMLETDKINKLLGTDISRDFMADCLESLGFKLSGDIVEVPSWRADVRHYTDLAEEVARLYGYNKIEEQSFAGAAAQGHLSAKQKTEREVKSICRAAGYSEILSYSFLGHSDNDKINMPPEHELRNAASILNPLGEDKSVMRTSMLPSVMQALSLNYAKRIKDASLFELARVYLPESGKLPDERKTLVLGAYSRDMDFYTLKGTAELILQTLHVPELRYTASGNEFSYHPGRCAVIYSGETCLGKLGQIHPSVCENYGINQAVYAAELDFENIFTKMGTEALYAPLPRYPAVYRDIAVICDVSVTVRELEDTIRQAGGTLLFKAAFFDVYTGEQVPDGKKSIAFSLEFRSDAKSLAEEDISPLMTKIIEKLSAHGAHIR